MFKQTETPVCRFCLIEYEHPENPLLEPCECKGSVAYVHKKCIQKWRITTQNPKSVRMCQLCLTNFKLPMRYPIESIPEEKIDGVWCYLSRPYIVWSFFSSFQLLIFVQMIIYNEQLTQSKYSDFTKDTVNRIQYLSYIVTTSLISFTYLQFYKPYILQIKNKRRYLQYWLKLRLVTNKDISPCLLVFTYGVSFLMTPHFQMPFFIFYLILLPNFFYAHRAILQEINNDNI